MPASYNPPSQDKIKRYHYIVFFIWLVVTLLLAVYFINNKLVEFDPKNTLSVPHQTIVEHIKTLAPLQNKTLEQTLIHFTQADCTCTSYSDEHKGLINQQAQQNNFAIIHIELPKNYQGIIPSTPALFISNNNGGLVYFGPYSEGLACSTSNGFAELALNNYAQGFNSQLVINQSSGCYCNN